MNQAQKARFEELKKKPHLLDQDVHGCCAFAAAIMHALVINSGSNLQLCKTVFSGTKFKDIAKSTQVKNRVEKRETDLKNLNEDMIFDGKLCVGLMVTFKEYLKENIKEKIWDSCIAFSQLFDNWVHGGKIKLGNQVPGFSYKHGDLALTLTGCQELISFYTGANSVRETVLSDSDFKGKQAIASKVKQSLTQLKKDFSSKKFKGAFLGVASNDWRAQKKYEKCSYLAHWVYVPRDQSKAKQNELEVWTWGAKYTFDLNNPETLGGEGYTPKILLKI